MTGLLPDCIFRAQQSPRVTDLLSAAVLHWTPEKAIWIGGHTLSWDARCAGIHIGFALGLFFHLAVEPRANQLSPTLATGFLSGLFAPLFIDVGTIHWGLRSASNDWRLLTGCWFGIGASAFLYPAVVASTSIRGANRAAISSLNAWIALVALGAAPVFAIRTNSPQMFYSLEALAVAGNVALFAITGGGSLFLLLSLGEYYGDRRVKSEAKGGRSYEAGCADNEAEGRGHHLGRNGDHRGISDCLRNPAERLDSNRSTRPL